MSLVVLVLRGSDRFSDLLRQSGIEVLNFEVTKTESLEDLSDLKKRIAQIDVYDGLFFTSPVAAEVFVREMDPAQKRFDGKIYVLGERTKKVFENVGSNIECRDDADTAGDLIEAFGESEFRGKRLLFVRGDKSMRTIPERLIGSAVVDEVTVYRTVDISPDADTVDEILKRLRSGQIDWICFFAPSSVDGFVKIFGTADLNGIRTAAIGKTTGQKLENSGSRPDFVSHRANAQDFATGLIDFIKRSE